ncbi:MAG: radical SAM protein [Ignisphaera sp.]
MGKILELIEEKKRIADEIRRMLSIESIEKAKQDHHSRRKPRPCGITIHTGIGCSITCLYCYIYDMGFPTKVKPYPLTALELVYALAINPYVIPRRTFAAYGSVTEPFLPETRNKALEYIANVYYWLKLPSQISTKIAIDEELAKKLKKAEPRISVLVSITTLNNAMMLERFAPNPLERLMGIETASKYGIPVYLFVRPIIPGITDREIHTIIKFGAEYNVKGVVLGSLRVTHSIIHRLTSIGINVDEILRRVPRYPKNREQIPVKSNDIIRKVMKIAQDYGLKVFKSACMANVDSHNEYCYMCYLGPCGIKKYYNIQDNDIAEFIETLELKVKTINIKSNRIDIVLRGKIGKEKYFVLKSVLAYATRNIISIEYSD